MNTDTHLDQIFSALAHSTRRALLERLRDGDASVGDLAEPHGMSLPAISRHLKVLENAGLIGRNIEGKFRSCYLVPGATNAATTWLEEHRAFWNEQLDALAQYADRLKMENGND